MKHLENWLWFNPQYADLKFPSYELTDIDDQRMWLNRLFIDALAWNPWDVNLLVSLGVLKFVDRRYKEAEVYFMQAIWENPTDYSIWNKYGAAMANYGNTEEAIQIYSTTLEIRPNLVRTWVNLGMAMSN